MALRASVLAGADFVDLLLGSYDGFNTAAWSQILIDRDIAGYVFRRAGGSTSWRKPSPPTCCRTWAQGQLLREREGSPVLHGAPEAGGLLSPRATVTRRGGCDDTHRDPLELARERAFLPET